MALGKTNISIDLVRRTLGSSKTDVGGLCLEDKVNMFSYYKPIDSQAQSTDPNTDWPANIKQNFGINIPALTLPVNTALNWTGQTCGRAAQSVQVDRLRRLRAHRAALPQFWLHGNRQRQYV